MKIEDLKNTKIYLHSTEDRVQFKNKLEDIGIRWSFAPSGDPLRHDIPFIYIDRNIELFMSSRGDFEGFCADKSRQIFLEDVLRIEAPKEEYKFKPFDRVLVRDFINDGKWLPRLFAEYHGWLRYGKYETTDGKSYNFCIPYEGNEHLTGTTKKP